jgi:hypothetical protein
MEARKWTWELVERVGAGFQGISARGVGAMLGADHHTVARYRAEKYFHD